MGYPTAKELDDLLNNLNEEDFVNLLSEDASKNRQNEV